MESGIITFSGQLDNVPQAFGGRIFAALIKPAGGGSPNKFLPRQTGSRLLSKECSKR
jgi:hypothetical protein